MQARITALAPAARSSLAATVLRFLWPPSRCSRRSVQPARAAEDEFLEPDKAFQFSARPHDAKRSRSPSRSRPATTSTASSSSSPPTGATLGTPAIPPARSSSTRRSRRTSRPIATPSRSPSRSSRPAPSSASSSPARAAPTRACAIRRMQSAAAVGLVGFGGAARRASTPPGAAPRRRAPGVAASAGAPPPRRRWSWRGIEAVLRGGTFWPIVGAFFIAGLLLSLTPCVLPMLPIVSSIIVGQGGTADRRVPAAEQRRVGRRVARRGFACRVVLVRHGGRLHGVRRRRRPGRRRPRRGAAEPVGARRLRARPGGAVAVDVRRLRAAAAGGAAGRFDVGGAASCRPAASRACSRWAASRR